MIYFKNREVTRTSHNTITMKLLLTGTFSQRKSLVNGHFLVHRTFGMWVNGLRHLRTTDPFHNDLKAFMVNRRDTIIGQPTEEEC